MNTFKMKCTEGHGAVTHAQMWVWIMVVTRSGFRDELMAARSDFICFSSDFKACFEKVKSFLSAK